MQATEEKACQGPKNDAEAPFRTQVCGKMDSLKTEARGEWPRVFLKGGGVPGGGGGLWGGSPPQETLSY